MSSATTPAGARVAAPPSPRPRRSAKPFSGAEWPQSTFLLGLLIVFFWLEYARPVGIVNLRLQFVISSVIPLFWLSAQGRPWSPVLSAQALFLGVNAALVPFVRNNFATYMTARVMYGNLAIALALSWLLSRRDWFRLVAWVWLAVMAYCALYGLTHGGRGPGGFLRDENDLALGCSTALAFCLFGFTTLRGVERLASGGLAVVFVSAIVATMSRGGFVGLLAVGLYFFLGSRHKLRDFGIALIASAALLLFAPKAYIDEIRSIQQTSEGTAERRKYLWATATNMWLAYPIFGVGGANFAYYAGDYQPMEGDWPEEFFQRSSSGTTVHSMFFQLLSEQGLVGIGLYGWMLTAHFGSMRRLRRMVATRHGVDPALARHVECYGAALSASVAGALAAGGFVSTLYYPYIWYFCAMGVALDVSARRELAAAESSPDPSPEPARTPPPRAERGVVGV